MYTLVIKRPGGIITGNITTYGEAGRYLADIKLYKPGDIIWDNLTGHEELETKEIIKTQSTLEDGTFEVRIIPGTYDLLIDKPGYLDYIVKNVTIDDKEIVDLGEINLVAGDIDKDGMIKLEDLTILTDNYGASEGISSNYDIGMDFTEDGVIKLEDLTILTDNYGQMRTILDKGGL